MDEDHEILEAMRDSIIFKMYPDIWTKYTYGGRARIGDKIVYVWVPIKKVKKE